MNIPITSSDQVKVSALAEPSNPGSEMIALEMYGNLTDIASMPRSTQSSHTNKTERIEARVTRDFKQRMEQAAALTGHTLSGFILHALQSSAREALEEHALAVLTAKESMAVANALLHPPAPNAHLRAADARYRRLVKSNA